MHKSTTKCNETVGKWYKNKHGASKIIDTLETYQLPIMIVTIFVLPLWWIHVCEMIYEMQRCLCS
jgi:hypothetical protein